MNVVERFKKLLTQNLPQKPAHTGVAHKDLGRIRVRGHVKIEARYIDGTKKILVEDKNMVVDQAAEIMPYMSLGTRPITYIELGDPATPTPPKETDTNLEQTTGERKAISGSVSGNQGTYDAVWLTTEGNGYTFTEMGLFTDPLGAGLMFARKTFSPIVKTASFAMTISWGLIFSVDDAGGGCSGVSLIGAATATSTYIYNATGGETSIVVPIDFAVGNKELDVYLNGVALTESVEYYEAVIGINKGITLIGFSLKPSDELYFKNRKLI